MNEIATRSEYKPPIQAGGSIGSIVPQNLDEAFRLSQAIHQAGMSPYGIDTPQKVMIAMLAGLELGMPPMQAVQSIAVINNRPCMWGDGLIGVVRRNPVCLYVKEWIDGTGDDRVAYCETKRKGEDEPVTRSFSVEDAKRAGLWQTEAKVTKKSRDGGSYTKENDSPWYKYPQRMLQMRARAWCLRDVYPDVLKGMHAREEVEDYVVADAEQARAGGPPLEERLRIAQQIDQTSPTDAEGFDHDHVTRETSALAGEAGNDQETPSGAMPAGEGSDGDPQGTPLAEAVAAEPVPAAADQAEEDAPESSSEPEKPAHGEQAASSSVLSDEDRIWLKQTAKMLWAATGVNEADVLKNQMAGIRENLTPATISKAARDKANSINAKCKLVCFGEASAAETLELIAGIAGCDVREIA